MSPAGQTLLSQGATRPRKAKSIAERKKLLLQCRLTWLNWERSAWCKRLAKRGRVMQRSGPGSLWTRCLSGFAHHRSAEQARVLFGPEAFCRRKPRQQFPHILFRAEEVDQ